MKIKYFITVILFFSFESFAQSAGNLQSPTQELDWENLNPEDLDLHSTWTFHRDPSSNILFIDFGALGGNFTKLVLKNEKNETVLADDHLIEVPTDAIYEISLNRFPKGNYVLELFSNKSVIKENITIR